MSTSTHTSSTASTTGGQDKLTALHEQISAGVAALVASQRGRAMLDTAAKFHSYRGNLLLIGAQAPASHPGRRVPHLAERGPPGTQGGAGDRDPGAVHLPPHCGRPGRAGRTGSTGRAGAGHHLWRGSGAAGRRRRAAGPGFRVVPVFDPLSRDCCPRSVVHRFAECALDCRSEQGYRGGTGLAGLASSPRPVSR